MKIGSFGNKKFVVTTDKQTTFSELSRTSSLATEKVENGVKKPKTRIQNIELDTFSIKVVLKNHSCDVRKEVDYWRKVKDRRKPYYFLIGNKKFGSYKWLLTGVEDSDYKIGPMGLSIAQRLNFRLRNAES